MYIIKALVRLLGVQSETVVYLRKITGVDQFYWSQNRSTLTTYKTYAEAYNAQQSIPNKIQELVTNISIETYMLEGELTFLYVNGVLISK